MDKWAVANTISFNGHESQSLDFYSIARQTVDFFNCAIIFLTKLSFGGPLYFRFKLNNTRGLRALFQNKTSTVLDDYLRLDHIYNITEITGRLPEILHSTLQAAAWSLGLRLTDEEINTLISRLLSKGHLHE